MAKPFALSMVDNKVRLAKVIHDLCELGFSVQAIGFDDSIEKLKLPETCVIHEGAEVGEKAPTKEGAYKNLLKLLAATEGDRSQYFVRGTVIITTYSLKPLAYEAWIRFGHFTEKPAEVL